ncbi:MAG: type IV pilus modification protein PilV [Thermomonas sp.]|nr:type IV pilus modification protein PilV [Thermomonas sp.]
MPRGAQGMSLIEVMVAVLVLAVGLLGIAAMQSLALRGGQSSLESSQAVMATSSMLEAIRANPTQAASYNMGKTCATPAAGTTRVSNDKSAWVASIKTMLGNAATTCGQVTNCGPGLTCTVTVFWDDSRGGADQGGSSRSLAVETQI